MKPCLWKPSEDRIVQSNLFRFAHEAQNNFTDFKTLWDWSVENPEEFWTSIWKFSGIIASTRGERITNKLNIFHKHRYFPDAKLNFAENLLRRRDDRTAIVFWGEDKVRKSLTYKQLYDSVARTAAALKTHGVKPGDRVAGYVANMPETIIAAIATASIGAIWSSCSPDFGVTGALDRFGQIAPKILFAVDGYYYKGKPFNNLEKIKEVSAQLPTLTKLVIIPYINAGLPINTKAIEFEEFIGNGPIPQLKFKQFLFNHPLYILFTSGTTGVPKCIVHGAGGTLIQHLKEHQLHCDIKPNDKVFYFTTCSWMMWNWLTSTLASEATLLLYDGSPLHPSPNILFNYADECGITLFGTSAKYLDMISKIGIKPIETNELKTIKTITSTGSPLSAESSEYVYKYIKKDVHLNSFSGGTDLISCFVTGNPISPVWAGEMQGCGLGMDVKVYGDDGTALPVGKQGELVCAAPFPSQPVKFWDDKRDKKYYKTYFKQFPNIWCHGDWMETTKNNGVIISGRADAILNPSGVRIGTAEIYEQVQKVHEVFESIAVGQQWDNDERVILFVVLREGLILTPEIIAAIKYQIKTNATPRHVPSKIIQVPAIPKTKNGKITEVAVKAVIHGREVKNKESLENPELLDFYKNIPELQTD